MAGGFLFAFKMGTYLRLSLVALFWGGTFVAGRLVSLEVAGDVRLRLDAGAGSGRHEERAADALGGNCVVAYLKRTN